jgi:hypothetical protein
MKFVKCYVNYLLHYIPAKTSGVIRLVDVNKELRFRDSLHLQHQSLCDLFTIKASNLAQ